MQDELIKLRASIETSTGKNVTFPFDDFHDSFFLASETIDSRSKFDWTNDDVTIVGDRTCMAPHPLVLEEQQTDSVFFLVFTIRLSINVTNRRNCWNKRIWWNTITTERCKISDRTHSAFVDSKFQCQNYRTMRQLSHSFSYELPRLCEIEGWRSISFILGFVCWKARADLDEIRTKTDLRMKTMTDEGTSAFLHRIESVAL